PLGDARTWFVNSVIEIETEFPPDQLLKKLKAIEEAMGRKRVKGKRWGSRVIDLDILLADQEIIDRRSLKVPHPELHKRRFVLMPLAELAPHVIHPQLGQSVSTLLATLKDDERGGERRPRGRAPLDAPHAVEGLEEAPVALEQPLERRERRRRRRAGLRARRAGKRLRPLERVGQLGHALGGKAPGRHEIRALARHGHEEIDVRRQETRVGMPEAAARKDEGDERLDHAPPRAYDPPLAAPMADSVPRLPAVYFEKLLDNSPDIVVAVDRRGTIVFYNDGARST